MNRQIVDLEDQLSVDAACRFVAAQMPTQGRQRVAQMILEELLQNARGANDHKASVSVGNHEIVVTAPSLRRCYDKIRVRIDNAVDSLYLFSDEAFANEHGWGLVMLTGLAEAYRLDIGRIGFWPGQ